jgi:CBS domain-containing protein
MPVADYCRRSPRTGLPGQTLRQAATQMKAQGVGCLVVVDDHGRPVGVVTDRDVALAVLRDGADPDTSVVESLLEGSIVSITSRASLAVAIRMMENNGLRRIPVVDAESGALMGILTSDDVLQLIASELLAAAEVARRQFPAELREGAAATGS